MTVKKTITLQDDVAKIALKHAKLVCNGNLSNYINFLIYNANKEEIDELQKNKPKSCGVVFEATRKSVCEYCGKDINTGDKICSGRYPDGHVSYIHEGCCRD